MILLTQLFLYCHVIVSCRFNNDLVTIIIPRHINRCEEIKDLCNRYKLSSQVLNDKELNWKNVLDIQFAGILT